MSTNLKQMKRQGTIEYLKERLGREYVYTSILDWSGIHFIFGNVVADNLFDLVIVEREEVI